jgi:hypothetical protein
MHPVEILIIIATVVLAIAGILNVGMILYLNWGSVRFTYVRILQTSGHLFSTIMVFGRIPIVMAGENPVPVWIGSTASIADFLYIWISNLYYIELLKAISLKSKVFTSRNIFYLQILTTVIVFAGYGSTIFRFTLFVDTRADSWAKRVILTHVVGIRQSFCTDLLVTLGIFRSNLCFAGVFWSIGFKRIQNG